MTAEGQSIHRGLYEGFEGYRTPSEDDYRQLLSGGLVVLDTNVLLNLYRYTAQARSDLLEVLTRLGERLWVPHQVLAEFWRNRERAVRDPEEAAERALSTLEGQRTASIQTLRTWANRVALDVGQLGELQTTLDDAFSAVGAAISAAVDAESTSRVLDTAADTVLRELEPLLAGRVGPPYADSELDELRSVAKSRIERAVPPGYMDAGKSKSEDPDLPIGDYLVWEQVLREAERRRVDVLLVTGDVKEDWWRRVDGESRGPRVELAEELRTRAGVRLFMLRPESLLVQARRVLQVEVSDESVEDVERVARFLSTRDAGEWTAAAAHQLLARLEDEAPVQAAAIRQAAMEGGFVTRDDVYSLGGYEATRTLRGFTRPANRIADEFRDRGLIPEGAPDPLEAVYNPEFSWVLASGFRIPPQLVDLLQKDVQGS